MKRKNLKGTLVATPLQSGRSLPVLAMLVLVRRAAPARVVAAHVALDWQSCHNFQAARCSEQSQPSRSHQHRNGGEQMFFHLKQIVAATASIQMRATRKKRMRSSRRALASPGLRTPPSVRARKRTRTRTMAQMKGTSQKRMKTVTNQLIVRTLCPANLAILKGTLVANVVWR